MTINVKTETTMTSTFPTAGPAASLSLLVLLPSSAHIHQFPTPLAPPSRPAPLTSRQSGSTVPSMRQLSAARRSDGQERKVDEEAEIDKVMAAGRRLSLAPGIGTGTEIRASERFKSSLPPLSDYSIATPPVAGSSYEAPPSFGTPFTPEEQTPPPAFGAKRGSVSRVPASRRRPQTAAGPAIPLSPAMMVGVSRGSIALPSGSGLGFGGGGNVGKTRPGWEGDEVVRVLRNSGLEATVIRNATHLPLILSPTSSSPSYPSFSQQTIANRPSTPTAITQVILVPLCDSPSLPSLSLLLAQGTNPTAVCFQQDLLDRAKRTEDEWLPSALKQIKTVTDMRDRAVLANQQAKVRAAPVEVPVILAYSANSALSLSTIEACVAAGASGVLKPLYDLETSKLLRRMVRAARVGRISSVVGLGDASLSSPTSENPEPMVVLPETALRMGGEHEGEKVLSAAMSIHRRAHSGQNGGSDSSPSGRRQESTAPMRMGSDLTRKQSAGQQTSSYLPTASSHATTSPVMAKPDTRFPPNKPDLNYFAEVYRPSLENRRRSVDVSGLCIALCRAQKVFETAASALSVNCAGEAKAVDGYTFPDKPPKKNQLSLVREAERKSTELAELLSAMYYQSTVAIQIEMVEYAELSAPLSREYRTRLVDAAATWDFKPHNLDVADLFRVACILFEGILDTEGIAELDIERDQIKRLLFAIREIYHAPNPYHNYVHAIDVLQASYTFLIALGVAPPFSYLRDYTPGAEPWVRPDGIEKPVCGLGTRRAREVLRPQDVLAILVAAMGHDVGHPGLSNAFMKNAKTPLSQVFDDKSVLENMHYMLITQLLRKHGFDFLLSSLPSSVPTNPARKAIDTKAFRNVLSSAILATDMSLHFAWILNLKEFGASISRGEGNTKLAKQEAEMDRITLCQSLIKCADISNPTRPIDVSEHWSTVLLKEWAVQASLEQDLDLPVSVVASADAALQAKGQIGFIDLFSQPLFEAVSDVLPELQCYADWCAENRSLWQQRLNDLTAAADATHLVQPIVESAADEERFRTLFPLSLPASLVGAMCLEPGPIGSSPTSPKMQSSLTSTAHEGAESPAAKAMRAVYHANLLDHRHRLSSYHGGIASLEFAGGRRMSSPNTMPSPALAM